MNLEEKVEYLMRELETLKQKINKRLQFDNFAIEVSNLPNHEYIDLVTALRLLGAKKNEKYNSDYLSSLDQFLVRSNIYLCVNNGFLEIVGFKPSNLIVCHPNQIVSQDIYDFISQLSYSLRYVHINDCEKIISKKCEECEINYVNYKIILDILDEYIDVCPSCNRIFELDELKYSNYDYENVCEHCEEEEEED